MLVTYDMTTTRHPQLRCDTFVVRPIEQATLIPIGTYFVEIIHGRSTLVTGQKYIEIKTGITIGQHIERNFAFKDQERNVADYSDMKDDYR